MDQVLPLNILQNQINNVAPNSSEKNITDEKNAIKDDSWLVNEGNIPVDLEELEKSYQSKLQFNDEKIADEILSCIHPPKRSFEVCDICIFEVESDKKDIPAKLMISIKAEILSDVAAKQEKYLNISSTVFPSKPLMSSFLSAQTDTSRIIFPKQEWHTPFVKHWKRATSAFSQVIMTYKDSISMEPEHWVITWNLLDVFPLATRQGLVESLKSLASQRALFKQITGTQVLLLYDDHMDDLYQLQCVKSTFTGKNGITVILVTNQDKDNVLTLITDEGQLRPKLPLSICIAQNSVPMRDQIIMLDSSALASTYPDLEQIGVDIQCANERHFFSDKMKMDIVSSINNAIMEHYRHYEIEDFGTLLHREKWNYFSSFILKTQPHSNNSSPSIPILLRLSKIAPRMLIPLQIIHGVLAMAFWVRFTDYIHKNHPSIFSSNTSFSFELNYKTGKEITVRRNTNPKSLDGDEYSIFLSLSGHILESTHQELTNLISRTSGTNPGERKMKLVSMHLEICLSIFERILGLDILCKRPITVEKCRSILFEFFHQYFFSHGPRPTEDSIIRDSLHWISLSLSNPLEPSDLFQPLATIVDNAKKSYEEIPSSDKLAEQMKSLGSQLEQELGNANEVRFPNGGNNIDSLLRALDSSEFDDFDDFEKLLKKDEESQHETTQPIASAPAHDLVQSNQDLPLPSPIQQQQQGTYVKQYRLNPEETTPKPTTPMKSSIPEKEITQDDSLFDSLFGGEDKVISAPPSQTERPKKKPKFSLSKNYTFIIENSEDTF